MGKMTTPFGVVLEMMVISGSAAPSFLPTNRTAATMAGKQDASRSVNGLHIRSPDKLTDKRPGYYWPVFYCEREPSESAGFGMPELMETGPSSLFSAIYGRYISFSDIKLVVSETYTEITSFG